MKLTEVQLKQFALQEELLDIIDNEAMTRKDLQDAIMGFVMVHYNDHFHQWIPIRGETELVHWCRCGAARDSDGGTN